MSKSRQYDPEPFERLRNLIDAYKKNGMDYDQAVRLAKTWAEKQGYPHSAVISAADAVFRTGPRLPIPTPDLSLSVDDLKELLDSNILEDHLNIDPALANILKAIVLVGTVAERMTDVIDQFPELHDETAEISVNLAAITDAFDRLLKKLNDAE